MILPTSLDYPIIAIADLHGQLEQLERLVARLEMISEWDDCALVFLGDYFDRGEDVPGTIDMVLELLSRRPGGSALLGTNAIANINRGSVMRKSGGFIAQFSFGRGYNCAGARVRERGKSLANNRRRPVPLTHLRARLLSWQLRQVACPTTTY